MIIIRAKRVSGDVAGGGGAPTNDYDDGDYEMVVMIIMITTTTCYYLHLKIALSTVAVTSNLTN